MEGRTAQERTILRDPPDLFAHFGVDLRPEVGEAGPVIAATACPDCGWWQRADDPATCCPLCARQHETSDPVDVAS